MLPLVWRVSGRGASLGFLYPAYDALMILAWVLTVLGYFKRFLNVKNRLQAYLTKASFPIYIFHFLPITLVSYFIAQSDLNVWLKWATIVAVAYPSTLILYEIVRRIPVVRFFFGAEPG